MAVQLINVGKNLTPQEAMRIAKRKAKKDFRGSSYNPKTGIVKLV